MPRRALGFNFGFFYVGVGWLRGAKVALRMPVDQRIKMAGLTRCGKVGASCRSLNDPPASAPVQCANLETSPRWITRRRVELGGGSSGW